MAQVDGMCVNDDEVAAAAIHSLFIQLLRLMEYNRRSKKQEAQVQLLAERCTDWFAQASDRELRCFIRESERDRRDPRPEDYKSAFTMREICRAGLGVKFLRSGAYLPAKGDTVERLRAQLEG